MKKVPWIILLLLLTGAVACRKENTSNLTAQVDRQFALEAAQTNLIGLRLGQLVQNNAEAADVKEYSRGLSEYYTLATNDLLRIAQRKSISLPSALGTINQRDFEKLAELRGGAFDQAYINWAVRSHQQTLDLLKQHVATTTDEDLKTWATTRVPALQEQLSRAQAIQRRF
jgi:putative membrane protein